MLALSVKFSRLCNWNNCISLYIFNRVELHSSILQYWQRALSNFTLASGSGLEHNAIDGSVAWSSTIWCGLYQKSDEKSFSWHGVLGRKKEWPITSITVVLMPSGYLNSVSLVCSSNSRTPALSLGCASLLKGSMGRKQKGLRGRITIPLIDGYQHHQATVYN